MSGSVGAPAAGQLVERPFVRSLEPILQVEGFRIEVGLVVDLPLVLHCFQAVYYQPKVIQAQVELDRLSQHFHVPLSIFSVHRLASFPHTLFIGKERANYD